MADVQLENGYVAIANRLYEAVLQADFREAHLRIVLALVRVTFGWRQKSARLESDAQLARYAGLEPHGGGFRRALRELAAEGVIRRYRDGTIALEKDFARWGIFSVAEAMLESRFGERPDAGAVPAEAAPRRAHSEADDAPTRAHDAPRRAHDAPVRAQVGVVSREESTDSTAENHRKTVKDNIIITARELSVAANQGLAEHPTAPQPIARILATSGSSHAAAEAISQAGVPTAFAKSHVYELARTHKAERPIGSLRYFVDAVVLRWNEHTAGQDAAHASRPAPAASRRGDVSGTDPDVWKRAAEEIDAGDRKAARATPPIAACVPMRKR